MKKKLFAVLAVFAVIAGIGAAVNVLKKEDSQTYKVGICQFTQHKALDAATQGFKDALTERLQERVV